MPRARTLLVDAPAHWPRVELRVRVTDAAAPDEERLEDAIAVLRLRAGGWVEVDRQAGRAVFSLPAPPAEGALVHPHLATVAGVQAYWRGRESFHAGGLVAGDGVWGLLGDRGAGKSSVLASLALAGVPIMCDDLLVVADGTALAGPRSIDLRSAAAHQLGCGEALGMVGGRERWRLTLEPLAAEMPLRGWVLLQWGDDVAVVRGRGAQRLRTLLPHRAVHVPPLRPAQLLGLASLPVLELRRPQQWSSHEHAIAALLHALGS